MIEDSVDTKIGDMELADGIELEFCRKKPRPTSKSLEAFNISRSKYKEERWDDYIKLIGSKPASGYFG